MTGRPARTRDASSLRGRAEAMESEKALQSPENLENLSPEEIRRTLHELRVHQIELEMQNEELHRVQAELDASRARYFDLYDLAPVGYCTVSEQGLILEANLTAARLLSVARGALVAHPLTSFITPEDQDLYYLRRKHLFKTGEPQACELRMLKQDGTAFWVYLETTVSEGADGARVGRVVMSDISARKREAEERTKLAAQLIQAQKMETIGCLAGGVAHDFNNLLTVINGYSKLLLADLSASDPMHASVAQINKAGERAAGLTRQLLAFSRKQVLHPRRLDLNRLVEDMRPMVERLLGEAVEVLVALNAESGTVCADPHQLEQVIMNLAVNAHDAMVGGGKLEIETAQVERDQVPYVMLAVGDNGVGMDEETRRRMFEPFFTTKGVGQGTGLGLSMVQGIVAQSGGYIDVWSECGIGTTFKIYLPAAAEAADDAGTAAGVPALRGHETVLVVEDREEVRHYAVAALAAFGYRVIQAENGEKALMLYQRECGHIDLILTDVSMPNMSGGELADRLQKLQPGIKVLFMSGYADDAVVRDGELEMGRQFIQKPFGPKELAGKVRAVLGPPKLAAGPGGRR